jgi:hypothetical protein
MLAAVAFKAICPAATLFRLVLLLAVPNTGNAATVPKARLLCSVLCVLVPLSPSKPSDELVCVK